MTWTPLCPSDMIPEGEMQAFTAGETQLLVYRAGGKLYATSNICPHAARVYLSDGFLEGTIIECPLHGAQFDITTGAVLCGPAEQNLESWPVEDADGEIRICLADQPIPSAQADRAAEHVNPDKEHRDD